MKEFLTYVVTGITLGASFALIGSGFVPQDESVAHAAWLVFCLAAVLVVRIYGTTDRRNPRPQWGAIMLSAVAYPGSTGRGPDDGSGGVTEGGMCVFAW